MSDVPVAPTSPTGAPTLPAAVVKYGALIFGLVGVVAALPESFAAAGVAMPQFPALLVAVSIAKALLGVGVVLGIASQGVRKPPVDAAQAAGLEAGKTPGPNLGA